MSVKLCGVSKSFDQKAVLTDFSLELFSDKVVTTLFGPSGCGKTTLLRLLAGLERPEKGSITITADRISMVFQEDRLLPWLTARDNICFSLPQSKGEAVKAADKWLGIVELSEAADAFPDQLSGGMQRRVALARCSAYGGDLFLLDEPFKGLEASLKWRIADRLFSQEIKPCCLLITHDPEEALICSDEVIVVDGPPLRVIRRFSILSDFRKRLADPELAGRYKDWLAV